MSPFVLTVPFPSVGTPFSLDSVQFVQTFDPSLQLDNPVDVTFRPGGATMFISANDIGDDRVFEYALSTPWDISTAMFVQPSPQFTGTDGTNQAIAFKPDGATMFVNGGQNDRIYEYELGGGSPGGAWDISTASLIQFFPLGNSPIGLHWKPDGTKYFVNVSGSDTIFEYSVSPAWDISTTSSEGTFAVGTAVGSPAETGSSGIYITPDGTKMFLSGAANDLVYEFILRTPWSVVGSPGPLFTNVFDISNEETAPFGLTFSDDGANLYICGFSSGSVHQYSLVQ